MREEPDRAARSAPGGAYLPDTIRLGETADDPEQRMLKTERLILPAGSSSRPFF